MVRSILAALTLLACSSTTHGTSGCPSGKICDTGTPAGPVHGLRADGTVDVTPDVAWPDRATEPAPLSAQELADACAIQSACVDVDLSHGGTEDSARQLLLHLCVDPAQSYFWEERAVPTTKKNERWTWEARAILAGGGGCNALAGASSPRADQINCEEVGCWWSSPNKPVPTVTCSGTAATLATAGSTITRDCAHALAACDPTSPTGCTDRAPAACEHPAKDRCDGDVRIGCDGTGRVSFHDCSRVPGGHCVNNACVYPDNASCTATGCNGDVLSLCVLGNPVDVDCKALGLSGCRSGYCIR